MHFKLHFASGWGMDLGLSVGYESLTFLGYHHELGGRSITWNNGDQIVSKSLYCVVQRNASMPCGERFRI